MQSFITMAQIQGLLFVYMLVGYFVRKAKLFDEGAIRGCTNLLIYVLLPCMVLDSFHRECDIGQLIAAGRMLIVAFAASFLAILLGKLLYRRYPVEKQTIMRYGTLVANSGFAGLPMAKLAYGELGLFYASIFVIPTRIFMWSAGISMFTVTDRAERLRKVLLNPGIIAVVVGMAVMLLQIPIPTMVGNVIANLGDCTTVLSLVIVGAILAEVDVKSIFRLDVLYLSAVRLILMPLLVIVLCRVLAVDPTATACGAILTGMPVGSTTAILAKKYGADAGFASKCVFLSVVLSLITIPLLSLVL